MKDQSVLRSTKVFYSLIVQLIQIVLFKIYKILVINQQKNTYLLVLIIKTKKTKPQEKSPNLNFISRKSLNKTL